MNSESILGSSLTFQIKNSQDIQEILKLVRIEAKKGGCSESEITLITTAVSEVCRKFMIFSESVELTMSVLSKADRIELQGKAFVKAVPSNIDLDKAMQSLNTYFNKSSIKEDSDTEYVSYLFSKEIPKTNSTQN